MSIVKEFKDFAMRGNLIDMAIGIVIGASFGTVTKTFIDGIFMPLIGLVFQIEDLSNHKLQIGKTNVMLGAFAGAIINFIIIAFVMFMIIKGMNALKKKQDAAPVVAAPTKEEVLLTEIRDLLKNK